MVCCIEQANGRLETGLKQAQSNQVQRTSRNAVRPPRRQQSANVFEHQPANVEFTGQPHEIGKQLPTGIGEAVLVTGAAP